MSKSRGKSKLVIILICVCIVLFSGWAYLNNVFTEKKPLSYQQAIDKVYCSDISGMATVISKVADLHGNDAKPYNVATGNKDDNFSANNKDGVKLWSSKQLFLSLKTLKIVREGLPEILAPQKGEYYVIQTNQDYYGKNKTDIYYLSLFVNSKNYHIYIPKDYYEPNKLQNLSTDFIEYEPNEIIKNLIDDILVL